jgi:hypothetical protein
VLQQIGVKKMKKLILVSIGVLLLALATGVFAGETTTMLFDRGLPTANQNAADASRSNIAWADNETSIDPKTGYPVEYWVAGDDFTISHPGKYKIRTIRVWIVGSVPDIGGAPDKGEKREKNHLTLWGGTVSKGVGQISHNYTVTPVTYSNGESYVGSLGRTTQINQIDFDVDFDLQGGETFTFFVDGPWVLFDPIHPTQGYVNASLHASNRKLSGSLQEGANDWLLWLHRKDGATLSIDTYNSKTGEGTLCPPDNPCPGWDKPSDGNVQVFGQIKQHRSERD